MPAIHLVRISSNAQSRVQYQRLYKMHSHIQMVVNIRVKNFSQKNTSYG